MRARGACSVLFRKMTKETSAYVRRQFEQGNDISWRDAVKGNTITQGLRYSLATGNWGLQGDIAIKPGVAQVRFSYPAHSAGTPARAVQSSGGATWRRTRRARVQALNRLTFASTLSHLRRVNCPTGREGKNPKPRQLHNSQWGVICPAETPEGHQVGLVKNLALMTQVTVGRPSEATDELHTVLSEWGTDDLGEIAPSVIAEVPFLLLAAPSCVLARLVAESSPRVVRHCRGEGVACECRAPRCF